MLDLAEVYVGQLGSARDCNLTAPPGPVRQSPPPPPSSAPPPVPALPVPVPPPPLCSLGSPEVAGWGAEGGNSQSAVQRWLPSRAVQKCKSNQLHLSRQLKRKSWFFLFFAVIKCKYAGAGSVFSSATAARQRFIILQLCSCLCLCCVVLHFVYKHPLLFLINVHYFKAESWKHSWCSFILSLLVNPVWVYFYQMAI